MLRVTEEDTQKVNVLNSLAYNYRAINPKEQVRYGLEALEISQKIDYKLGVGKSLTQIGSGLGKQGFFDSALQYSNEALIVLETTDSQEDIVACLKNIGETERMRSNFSKATEYYLRALSIEEEFNIFKNRAGTINNLAIVYYYQKDYQKALDYYRRAYILAQASGEQQNMAMALYNIGGIYEDHLTDLDSALFYHQKSLVICEKLNIAFGIGVNKGSIASTYNKMGRNEEALPILESAIEELKKTNRIPMILAHQRMLGELYTSMGRMDQAEKVLIEALNESKKISSVRNMRDITLALSNLYEESNQWEKALSQYKEFRNYDDSIVNESKSKEVLELQTKYESEKKEKENQALLDQARIREQQLTISRGWILFLIVLVLFVSTLAYYFIRNVKLKKKVNQDLREMNKKILEQHAELERTLHDLQVTQKQLIQSEKMASLGVLSAGIGHEINNPLNFIKNGTVELIKKIKNIPDYDRLGLKQFIEIIQEGVDRASVIVKSLGHFSRSGVSFDEECNVNDILDNCLVILENRLKDRITVKKVYSNDSLVKGNSGKLHQAFLNVISNAEHAIHSTGIITIITSKENGYLEVKIIDTGDGIDQSISSKISDPFFTTKDPGYGVGLGLPITYSIIDEHNGNIEFESEHRKGTEFRIKLPVEGK